MDVICEFLLIDDLRNVAWGASQWIVMGSEHGF